MGEFEACDNIPAKDRKYTLKRIVFERDIFKPLGFLERERFGGKILDLGCGKGAVGAVLKEINSQASITGVDKFTYEDEENFLNLYDDFIEEDAVEAIKEIARKGEKFDVIISVGLPWDVIDKLILETPEIFEIVNPGGFILLMTDLCAGEFPQGTGVFQRIQGSVPVDHDILFWEKK